MSMVLVKENCLYVCMCDEYAGCKEKNCFGKLIILFFDSFFFFFFRNNKIIIQSMMKFL